MAKSAENAPLASEAMRLARIHFDAKNHRAAAKMYQVAFDSMDGKQAFEDAMNRGSALRQIGNYVEAVRQYDSIARAYPNHPRLADAWYRLY